MTPSEWSFPANRICCKFHNDLLHIKQVIKQVYTSVKVWHFHFTCLWIYVEEWEWDLAQAVQHPSVNAWVIWSILHNGCICSLGYFLFQPVVHNWSLKGSGMCCPVHDKVHIKEVMLLIRKSSLCGDSRFPRKKYVRITICLMYHNQWYENQCVLGVIK